MEFCEYLVVSAVQDLGHVGILMLGEAHGAFHSLVLETKCLPQWEQVRREEFRFKREILKLKVKELLEF